MRGFGSGLVILLIAALSFQAQAAPLRFGMDSNTLAPNDDSSSEAFAIGFDIDFFGIAVDQVYVNNNGNVTFEQGYTQYTSEPLSSIDRAIIAPFFADVDTNNGIGEAVTYGQGIVKGRLAFGVNWFDVNYYENHIFPELLNSFQLVLIDRSDTGAGNFDIEFNYGDIRWESGAGSGGNSWGLGGRSARAGFSAGTQVDGSYIELEGSGVAGSFIDGGTYALGETSNVGVAGRHAFEVRAGVISAPAPVPLPAALPAFIAALGGLVLLRRRRR